MKQSEIMLAGEGDEWFKRNEANLGKFDPVSAVIEGHKIEPKSVLEIGCANGWRLAKLGKQYGCRVAGIDPSKAAMLASTLVPMMQATAEALPFEPQSFDMVIYGFCLYLTDPVDWMKIAAEGDRVLKPGGHLIIHDFFMRHAEPFAVRYKHRDDSVLSYHYAFKRLWSGTPFYRVLDEGSFGDEMVTVLRKIPVEEAIKVRP
jgi:ubiquinone/menaquinone biosynthesis C-methylase UbiE